MNLTRRTLLRSGAALATGALASARAVDAPAATREGRLVVLLLRGGMDGLFAFSPVADHLLPTLRPTLSQTVLAKGIALGDTGFSAHPSCQGLADLFAAKELVFSPQGGTTDASRSHFQAQDLLELGTGQPRGQVGWMGRLALELAGHPRTAPISFTNEVPLSFRGAEPPPEVAPLSGSGLKLPDNKVLAALRRAHAQQRSGEAIGQALETQALIDATMEKDGASRGAANVNGFPAIAGHMGRLLRHNPRWAVSFMDLGGFDTHAAQENLLGRGLTNLSDGLVALKTSLGPTEWSRTRVVVMTEFGRTVKENGTQGTDHGHGGLMLLAGGAIGGGRMVGDFSGLAPAALNEGRDLVVQADWRGLLAATLSDTLGLAPAALDRVLPGRGGSAGRWL